MINPVVQELFATDQAVKPLETTVKLRRRLGRLIVASLLLHIAAVIGTWLYPMFATIAGLRNIQLVDEAYNKAILLDFSKKLKYPPGYEGFRPPNEAGDLKKLKAAEERRRHLEEARRQRELERAKREEAQRKAEEDAKKKEVKKDEIAQKTENETAPKPTSSAAPFRKINTKPIKDQVEILYEAKKAGKLVFNENKLKIGVAGKINADGSLSDCRVIIPSGNPDVDRAALAILAAVSESHALGPLHELSSLSLILEVDQRAELRAVGFAGSEQLASSLTLLANGFLALTRKSKADDPASMVLLNNLKVTQTGQRIQAVITMPRQSAAESLARTMDKAQN